MMSWANESLIEDGRSQSDIRQGVTLEIMGEGRSMGPINEDMRARADADAADSPIMAPYYPHWRRAADVVAAAWRVRGRKRALLRAAIGHAIAFPTWRSLVRDQRLTDAQAVELMLRLTCDCD